MPERTKPSKTQTATSPAKRSSKSNGEQGWAAVAKKQAEKQAAEEAREEQKDRPKDFYMYAGESAQIQFLQDEPFTYQGHSIKDKWGNFKKTPCQLETQKTCLMCREKMKQIFLAAFKLIDYRGTWEKFEKPKGKVKGKFLYDGPVEKLWIVNLTILGALQSIVAKNKPKQLSELVLEVTRTGSGKNDTSYAFTIARDDDDVKLKPVDFDEEWPSAKKLCKPLDDDALEAMGFEKPEDDTRPARKKKVADDDDED